MRKLHRSLVTCACLTAMLLLGGAVSTQAETVSATSEPIRIYGPIAKEGGGRISIDNQSQISYKGQMILNTSQEYTRILDAVTGLPVAYDSLKDGEVIYAYIGQTMTMSLPPMTTASMVLCNIPADFKVPDLVTVKSMDWNSGKSSGKLTAADGTAYTVAAGTQIFPYLTRNIVTLDDLTESRTCLVWSDSSDKVSKILLFAEENRVKTGWVKEDGNWYYNQDGTHHVGWLLDGGKWYYLNPDTGIMQTGFLELDGKTYYLQGDGSMMVTSKMFTPDKDGVLR